MAWKLAEAKNKFSEVFRRALQDGPQRARTGANSTSSVILRQCETSTYEGAARHMCDL